MKQPRGMAATRRDAASYYRILCPFSVLKYQGWNVEIGTPSLSEVPQYDVLWLQQHADAGAEILARAYKDAGKIVVYDVDDWLFDLPPSWRSYDDYYQRGKDKPKNSLGFYERLLQMSDVVTTTTPYLKDKILARYPDLRVEVIPNCVMAGDWDTIEPQSHNLKGPVLGWFGTGNHWDDWVEIAPIIDEVLEAVGGNLAIIGAPELQACFPGRLRKRTQTHVLMRVDRLPMLRLLLTACDVGLAWVSSRLEAGKCRSPLKALQWGAAGVPLVASETVYGQMPSAGIGFALSNLNNLYDDLHAMLCGARSQWRASIAVWQQTVFNEHSYETKYRLWADLLTSL